SKLDKRLWGPVTGDRRLATGDQRPATKRPVRPETLPDGASRSFCASPSPKTEVWAMDVTGDGGHRRWRCGRWRSPAIFPGEDDLAFRVEGR
ncbi:hypothetical protein Ccrd_015067, partial [Cynara cardunculus var. scolymus]